MGKGQRPEQLGRPDRTGFRPQWSGRVSGALRRLFLKGALLQDPAEHTAGAQKAPGGVGSCHISVKR